MHTQRRFGEGKGAVWARAGRLVLSIALVSAPGCSLLVDTSGLAGSAARVDAIASDASTTAEGDASAARPDGGGGGGGGGGADARSGRCTTVGPAGPTEVTGWWKPGGARVGNDGIVATGDEADGQLVATGFGLVVPRGARVAGVTVTIVRRADAAGISDREVALVGGAQKSASRAAEGVTWPTAMGAATYGGPDDSWGLTLSADEVQRPVFGVSLAVDGSAPTASVDAIAIAITYCE